MNASRGRRAAVSRVGSPYFHLSTSRLSPICRLPIINPRSNGLTTRSMWWWSRRHDCDEDTEERFLRHQKLMRNRYSKLLRRRTIWEGNEHAQTPVWARSRRWLVTSWADKKALSYQRVLQAAMQDPDKRYDRERPWKEWDRDFDKLKTRIDEEIDLDPYNSLFGRHLRGPPSPNNSSWTSFSWIYKPLKSMQRDISNMSPDGTADSIVSTVSASSPEGKKTFSVPPRAPGGPPSIQSSSGETEYEFDPISMRKVPKRNVPPSSPMKPSAQVATPPMARAFLNLFFSEHGVEIPVKPYKAHKVYGHTGPGNASAKPSKDTQSSVVRQSGIDLESSRLRDLQALKFKTLGNSIDTTAEYGGKYKNPEDPEPIHVTTAKEEQNAAKSQEVVQEHPWKDISAEDQSELFAGTTYEAKAKAITSTSSPKPSFKTSWLEKEGFQTLPQALAHTEFEKGKPVSSVNVDITPQVLRIEPALNRLKAFEVKSRNRNQYSLRGESSTQADDVEDLELLRASDVRAATRSARITKREIEQTKQESRKRLETDYSKHQLGAAKFAFEAETAKERISRRLSSVWEHVKQYPQGIVAKTVTGMGMFNDSYKKYERPDRASQPLTEKLLFKDDTLSKTPSIYRKVGKKPATPLQTFTSSQEVLDFERAEKARLAFVRQVNEESKSKALEENKHAEALASQIRNVYEDHYGKIDINHRQPATAPSASPDVIAVPAPQGTAVTEFKKPAAALQPMGPATVKPGVEEDPVITNHVSVFEPKLAKIVDEAKSARKAIHETKLEVMAMKSWRPQTVWGDRTEATRIETALNRSSERQSPKTPPTPTEAPPVSSYTSDYIILAYNTSSDSVTISPLDSSMTSAEENTRKTSVPQILAGLNHTAKFLSHFASLSNHGYEVISGSGDVLVFKRRAAKVVEAPKSPLLAHVRAIIDKNKLAAQEISAQSATKTLPMAATVAPANEHAKEAATVLDEIPASQPIPGPAAPTAPPIGPPSFLRPKVKRQEQVFSASKTSRVSPPPAASAAQKVEKEEARESPRPEEGLWKRFKRGVKRVILTAAAMGAGAYAIGAVAESLGAQQPPEQAIRRGRPGIYSTENSR